MRIAIGSDHFGFPIRTVLAEHPAGQGYAVQDFGCSSAGRETGYPDVALALSEQVAAGTLGRGVLVCGALDDRAGTAEAAPRRVA